MMDTLGHQLTRVLLHDLQGVESCRTPASDHRNIDFQSDGWSLSNFVTRQVVARHGD